MIAYIYTIRNKVTGQCYIGSTINLATRERDHFSRLRNNRHNNQYLQRAYNKYGNDAFDWYPVACCNVTERYELEKAFIIAYPYIYNVEINNFGGGQSGPRPPEVREKISKAQRGRPLPPERAKVFNASKIGRKQKPETGRKRALNNPNRREVIDLTTGVTYLSVKEAARQLDLDPSAITKCCKGKLNMTGGRRWSYKQERG